ncbi:MAG: hypothetical protein LBM12_03425 [Candidatus Nomurabacteria bacterium]|jgi:uncharacterized coiled-coil protein SlyX|nr:hypothetical protein [Candidatus Nomurabacteria bacterium]
MDKPTPKFLHLVAVAAAFVVLLIGGIFIFNQSRTLSRVSNQITTLEQKTTTRENQISGLVERLDKVETDLAEQKSKTAPEALEAQFVEYYAKTDQKTNTIITLVVVASILLFAIVLCGVIFAIIFSHKNLAQKLAETPKKQ